MESKNQFKEHKERIKDAEEDKEKKPDTITVDESETITVDENYPGPKKDDIGKAEEPGIKDQEEDQHQ